MSYPYDDRPYIGDSDRQQEEVAWEMKNPEGRGGLQYYSKLQASAAKKKAPVKKRAPKSAKLNPFDDMDAMFALEDDVQTLQDVSKKLQQRKEKLTADIRKLTKAKRNLSTEVDGLLSQSVKLQENIQRLQQQENFLAGEYNHFENREA